MRRALAFAFGALLACLVAAACRRAPGPAASESRRLPKGDAVWLGDPAAAGEPGLEAQLQRLGATALFLPAGEVDFGTARWSLRADPPPPHPFVHVPIVLVVRPGPELSNALMTPAGPDAEGVAHAIAPRVAEAAAADGPYGRVAGLHLDFPFAAAASARYAELIRALRRALPPGAFVSISLRSLLASEEERKKLEPLLASADALVAVVFGAGARVDPVATDALRRPWWAAFNAAGPGSVVAADGRDRGSVPETVADRLTGNPRIEFQNDLSVNDASLSAFTLVARGPVRIDGLALEPGDRIAFRLPSLAEMLLQLGSTLAGKRFALGRILVFQGASEAERIFPLAAFEDVILGRALSPTLEARVVPLGRSSVAVAGLNRAHHASIVSRVSNWIEVDLSPAHPADVQVGGFDRYETYDASGRPVTPGRATRVRLFETLVAPLETISPARIVVRGALPAGCCRHREHVVSAAGPEIEAEWSAPPPTPVPAPKKAAPKRKRN